MPVRGGGGHPDHPRGQAAAPFGPLCADPTSPVARSGSMAAVSGPTAPPTPAPAAGAEAALVIVFLGLRAIDLLQVTVALPVTLPRSPDPGLSAGVLPLLAVESLLVGRVLLRAVRRPPAWAGCLDVGFGVMVLMATMATTRPADRSTAWAVPLALSVAMGAGIMFRSWSAVLGATAALTAANLATTQPVPHSTTAVWDAVAVSLGYVATAAAVRAVAGHLRRLARAAEMASAEHARHAAEAERHRCRTLLHDQASVLALLATAEVDEELRRAARAQAAAGSARIRAFLSGEPADRGGLARELATVAAEFPDLPLVVNTELARDDPPADVVTTVGDAVRTLLHNVRRHAGATEVVLHAETAGDAWEVTVVDDGVGFDPAATREGFGLAQQVRAALTDAGGHVVVASSAGEGTQVRMGSARSLRPTA
jgi:hypothetical protein